MSGIVAILLLLAAFAVGLVLIPFGLPGLWLMVLALFAYAAAGGFEQIGIMTLVVVVGLGILAELAEFLLGFRVTRRFGGSSRAGWGAVAGGLVGAVVGTPLPLIGNIVGAFVGAFVGAVLLETTRGTRMRASLGVGWGAVVGRAIGAAVKIGVALLVSIIGLFAALR